MCTPPGSLQCVHSLVFTHPYQPFPVHSPPSLEAWFSGMNVAGTLCFRLCQFLWTSRNSGDPHGTPMVCPDPQTAWLCCYWCFGWLAPEKETEMEVSTRKVTRCSSWKPCLQEAGGAGFQENFPRLEQGASLARLSSRGGAAAWMGPLRAHHSLPQNKHFSNLIFSKHFHMYLWEIKTHLWKIHDTQFFQ